MPRSAASLVLPLADVGTADHDLVGGKAANLGELINAGFAVPRGFCVTTEAYRRVAAEGGLEAIPVAQAGPAILGLELPDDIRSAVVAGYAELGRGPVAVRSSATAEDLPSASFAGQQESYLGVVGDQEVLAAVRRCWASLWTGRAIAYRETQGIDHASTRLAVVLQTMVDAAVAGVLFTANPVTGRRHEAVIDAAPGLGEAVVSGALNPDHLVVDTATGRVTEARTGDRRTEIRMAAAGGTRHVAPAPATEPCLTDAQAAQLADLGARIEKHFGPPQDIEWAVDPQGKLWLTQSRPITTLFPLPAPAARDGGMPTGLRAYFCFSLAQGLTRPLTPMGLSAARMISSAIADIAGVAPPDPRDGARIYAEAGQRMFLDLTDVLRGRVGRYVIPRVFDIMEARSAAMLRQLLPRPEFSITQRSLRPAVRRAVVIGWKYRIPLRIAEAIASPAAAHRRVARIDRRLRARLAAGVPAPGPQASEADELTPTERLDQVELILRRDTAPVVVSIAPAAFAGLILFVLTARLTRGRAEPGQLLRALGGLPHNVTTRMDLELWALSRRIRSDDAAAELFRTSTARSLTDRYLARNLPPVAQRGLADFLDRYGDRAVAEIDVGVPRWSEDPEHILAVIAGYLDVPDSAHAPDSVFRRSARDAADAVRDLRKAAAGGRGGRARGWLVAAALGRARQLIGIRETPKFEVVLALAAARRQLAILGAELTAAGSLGRPDDVFYLSLDEVRSGLSGAPLAHLIPARREEYLRETRRRHVPRVLLSDGTEPAEPFPDGTGPGDLAGYPASPGTVTGVARVIMDPAGARIEAGEILVAPSTDPGWTPLFLTAGGLVMEMGGVNSHGAVVAREYGIPAVVGVRAATARITTGRRITVNGTVGIVTPD